MATVNDPQLKHIEEKRKALTDSQWKDIEEKRQAAQTKRMKRVIEQRRQAAIANKRIKQAEETGILLPLPIFGSFLIGLVSCNHAP